MRNPRTLGLPPRTGLKEATERGGSSGDGPPPFRAPFPPSPGQAHLEAALAEVRRGLALAAGKVEGLGLPAPSLEGKLLRPLAAYLAIPPAERARLDLSFWLGALAVEMVHEASLLHDDILDAAATRRGRPTLAETHGIGAALVRGDHLLTASYRVAAQTGFPLFLETFVAAVERTVAGEIAQERACGRKLAQEEYLEVITAKSGELFRAAMVLAAVARGSAKAEAWGAAGARLGRLYQMADDLLDFCPLAGSGKPPLQDYRQRKWTWPLGLAPVNDFTLAPDRLSSVLFRRPDAATPSPMERAAHRFAEEVARWLVEAGQAGMAVEDLRALVQGWVGKVRDVVEREVSQLAVGESPGTGRSVASAPSAPSLPLPFQDRLSSLRERSDWQVLFARQARSFRFAASLFPPELFRKVAGVYAFCRFTDDLVDQAQDPDPARLHVALDTWLSLVQQAYNGDPTGIPLLDEVVGGAAQEGIPFHYLQELVEGVRMDITPRTYASLADLRVYSYRVASVVGGWLTELVGVRDKEVLEAAFALGHAMQLTNILRDVGEDLRRGRLYLPLDRLHAHGVDVPALEAAMAGTRPLPPAYGHLMEELMAHADEDYRKAWAALGALPPSFRRAVAVAAWVYRGIHGEIRRNGYDNLTRRAATSLPRKVFLATGALSALALGRTSWPRGRQVLACSQDTGSLPAVVPPAAPV